MPELCQRCGYPTDLLMHILGCDEKDMFVVTYDKKTDEQVRAFLVAYVTLCRAHGIHLGSDQDRRLCPVVEGTCDTSAEWLRLLAPAREVGQHRQVDEKWRKQRMAELRAELAQLGVPVTRRGRR